jgi:class 3 adenylate cyclase/tetratricopeptide (TPR) repeat protein
MSEVVTTCRQCASAVPAGARFCPACGMRVDATTTVDATAARPTSMPDGERRQVAILFADLSGYTRLSSTIDAEETHRLLTRFFECADEAIVRHGGTIDKHIGDAVMGVFGAPLAYGNDIERALRSALAIHAAMSAVSGEAQTPLAAHIGIASGEVVAASTGSIAHRDYTVTGDAVNLAARLTDLARAGETVLSDDVQRAASGFARSEPLGRVTLRGLPDDISAWRLVALHAPRASSPFVGRESERKRFADLLARARRDATGATLVVRADPGMGKSRLLETLLVDAAAAGAVCHASTVLDFGAGQGRDAIHALVASLLAIPTGGPSGETRDGLDRALAEDRADDDDERALADLLLIPQRAGSFYEAMDSEARRLARTRAVRGVVELAAQRNVLVLAIEDAHWASQSVLDHALSIAQLGERLPVVLVMTTRRDGDPISDSWPSLVRLDLAPLADGDAFALARAHLAAAPAFARRCVERAQGNPLFLVQLLASGADEEAVPPTIQSVVLARLDRLPPRDKAALQAAAVAGQRFSIELVRHLVGDPRYAADVPIARELVRRDDRDPSFLVFGHALIREGAYASLLRSARRSLHAAAAAWYEARDPTLRAGHLERAEDRRAAEAYLVAARGEAHAMRSEAALALAKRAAALAASDAVRFDALSLVGDLSIEAGDAPQAIAAFEQACDAAVDDAARCKAWIGIASGHRMTSEVTAGLAALDHAATLATGEHRVRERAQIAYLRGSLHFARGDLDACRQPHEEALAFAREAGDAEIEAWALSGLADALYAQGLLHSARDAFQRCLEICERDAMTRFSLMNHCMLAIIDAYFLRLDEARARIAGARRVARDLRHRLAETMCDESEAFILVTSEHVEEAAEVVARGLPLARSIGARRFEMILLVSLAQIEWHAGRHADARARLHEAWALCEAVGTAFAGGIVLGALARFAATRDERRAALRDGEALLRAPSISHSRTGFYWHAIEAALADRDWTEVERYAALLDESVKAEPLPLIDRIVARARTLAAAGRSNGAPTGTAQ